MARHFQTFIDLFCGIGGFRIAMEEHGLRCVWSCDIDRTVRNVYHENYGERPAGDIKIFQSEDIPPMDVICGGFPCQPFSVGGKMTAFKHKDGDLIWEVFRITEYHKPKMLILENVPHIKNCEGRVLTTICNEFTKIGYNCQWFELNGAEFGIPQARKRIYFLFIRNDIFEKVLIDYDGLRRAMWRLTTVGDILEPLEQIPDELWQENDKFDIYLAKMPLDRTSVAVCVGDKRVAEDGSAIRGGSKQGLRVYSDRGVFSTLTPRGNYIWDSRREQVRKLTKREILRLQGFDDNFKIGDKHVWRLVGNSVIPAMISLIYGMVKVKNSPKSDEGE